MKYRAREIYQNREIVKTYDIIRFKTIKGYLVDKREKYLIGKALRYGKIISPATILDLPCGTGRLSIYLARKGFKVSAGDLSLEMIKAVEGRIENQNLKDLIISEVSDAEAPNYPDDSFDAVVCLRLLGHAPPEVRIKILKELKRVSKKYLILAYYHRGCFQNLLRRRKRYRSGEQWHPVSLSEMEKEIKSAGLIKIKTFPLALGVSETLIVLTRKDEQSK